MPGLRRDVPARRQAARGGRQAQAERARLHARSSGAQRARRFLSRRRRARDRRRPGKDRQPGDARRSEALSRQHRRAAERQAQRRHALQHAAADAGAGVAHHPRAVRAPARPRSRGLRVRPRPRRGDQARLPRARPHRRRSGARAAAARAISSKRNSSTAKFARSTPARRRNGRRRRARATPSGWARRIPRASRCPTSSRSIGSSAPAACCRKTGVLMQNRGSSFSLDPKALNALAPGRLPFHTLNPALAVLNDGRVIAYGAMGGDGQPQSQAMIFARHVLHGQPLDKAIDAPRWLLGRTWGSTHTNLRMELRFDGHLIDRLMSAGHDVEVLPDAYSDTMGHAGAVVIHPNGTLEGAHDPRADGGAAGLSSQTRKASPGCRPKCRWRVCFIRRPIAAADRTAPRRRAFPSRSDAASRCPTPCAPARRRYRPARPWRPPIVRRRAEKIRARKLHPGPPAVEHPADDRERRIVHPSGRQPAEMVEHDRARQPLQQVCGGDDLIGAQMNLHMPAERLHAPRQRLDHVDAWWPRFSDRIA